MKHGIVYLVGAGPGDPGLLTVKGKKVLETADVVIYDRLINDQLLDCVHNTTERIFVGKESGKHSFVQEDINALLVEKVREGKRVVRLKGGDPFLFGRGGEEAVYLSEHGCAFEIVPGITSAIAAPAYAGIPVTHRDVSSSFAVITGHEKPGKKTSSIHWQELSRGIDTLVFLMGFGNLTFIVERLTANGKSPATPAALIRYGTLPAQEVITGVLNDIVQKAEAAQVKPPAVLVVGEVVTLRDKLQWSKKLPLRGKRIVVTRPEAQASSLVEKITALGGTAIEFPVIEIVHDVDRCKLNEVLNNIGCYDWIFFTSVNGVDIFFDVFVLQQRDIRTLHGIRICAIGPATKEKLRQKGLMVDVIPERYCAEGIIDILKEKLQPGQKVLLPRARGARTMLPEGLKALGVHVDEVYLYEAALPARVDRNLTREIINGAVDIIMFTSSSAVKNFINIIGKENINRINNEIKIACIGPITAETARSRGLQVAAEAKEYTIEGLMEAIEEQLKE